METIIYYFDMILREPSLFLGIIVLIGTLVQKKTVTEIIAATFKTIVGMRLVQVGANLLVQSSTPMMEMVLLRFNVQARIADPWTGVGESISLLEGDPLLSRISLIMAGAWLLHLLLSRFTRLKSVHLAAQILFSDTVLVCYFIYAITNVFNWLTVALMVVLLAIYWWLWPSLMANPMKRLIPDGSMTIGHNTMVGGILAILIARLTGDVKHDTEELNLPKWLKIMEDRIPSNSLIMALLFLGIAQLTRSEIISQVTGATDPMIFAFNRSIDMVAGLTFILYGVGIFQKELVPAFEGFARHIVPGAIPAMDAIVIWKYAPKATILGVISMITGMILGILLQVVVGSPYITIPSAIPMFIGGSTIGAFVSKFGGVRGTIISCVAIGVIQVFGSSWMASLVNFKIAGGGHIDFCTYWPALMSILKWSVNIFHNL